MLTKSRYSVNILLIDMKLSDASGNLVWSGNIKTELAGEDYADCYGWSVYLNANEALKDATNKLIKELMKVQ